MSGDKRENRGATMRDFRDGGVEHTTRIVNDPIPVEGDHCIIGGGDARCFHCWFLRLVSGSKDNPCLGYATPLSLQSKFITLRFSRVRLDEEGPEETSTLRRSSKCKSIFFMVSQPIQTVLQNLN